VPTINILYVTVKGLRFTSSQQLGLFVRRFSGDGFRCHVATYKDLGGRGGRGEQEELARLGVGIHRVRGLREWRRWAAIWRRPATLGALARIVREQDIHVIHSFQTSSAPYALAVSRRTGVPHVVQFRNTYDDRRHYMRFGLHDARVLLTLSYSMMKRYAELVGTAARPGQRRVVIPNGIAVEEYRQRASSRDMRRELGLLSGQPVIGIVGALSSRKDSLLVLEVAARVRATCPEARFLFVGGFSDDGYRAQFMERMHRLGLEESCLLAGHQADAAPWYGAMDLLLHTAWREGHAKVFNEAMVMGLPIVSSRITGSVDVVESGVNGLLCEPGDAAAFAAAVSELIASPGLRSSLGEAGRQRVTTLFSSERSLRLLEDLYRDVAGRQDAESG